jgi:hypothetical protein
VAKGDEEGLDVVPPTCDQVQLVEAFKLFRHDTTDVTISDYLYDVSNKGRMAITGSVSERPRQKTASTVPISPNGSVQTEGGTLYAEDEVSADDALLTLQEHVDKTLLQSLPPIAAVYAEDHLLSDYLDYQCMSGL